MKFTATKKTIIILTTCFILLISSCLPLFFRDVIFNGIKYGAWVRLNVYKELLEDCSFQKGGDNVVLKCEALLNFVLKESIESDSCYKFSIVPQNKEARLYPLTICESDDKFNWVNPYKNYDKEIPINLEINYKKIGFLSYTLNKIGIFLMSNESYENMFNGRTELGTMRRQIITKRQGYLRNKGYFYDTSLESLKGSSFDMFLLADFKIENVELIDNIILITVSGLINDKTVNMIIPVNRILSERPDMEDFKVIEESYNYNNYKILENYKDPLQLQFLISKDDNIKMNECTKSENNNLISVYCDNIATLDRNDTKDWQEVLEESLLGDIDIDFTKLNLVKILYGRE